MRAAAGATAWAAWRRACTATIISMRWKSGIESRSVRFVRTCVWLRTPSARAPVSSSGAGGRGWGRRTGTAPRSRACGQVWPRDGSRASPGGATATRRPARSSYGGICARHPGRCRCPTRAVHSRRPRCLKGSLPLMRAHRRPAPAASGPSRCCPCRRVASSCASAAAAAPTRRAAACRGRGTPPASSCRNRCSAPEHHPTSRCATCVRQPALREPRWTASTWIA